MTRNSLVYERAHQLLICLECQHAVTPDGFQRHLKRHKIYVNNDDDAQIKAEILALAPGLDLSRPPPSVSQYLPGAAQRELPAISSVKTESAGTGGVRVTASADCNCTCDVLGDDIPCRRSGGEQ